MEKKLHDNRVMESAVSTTNSLIYRNTKDYVFHDLFKDRKNILKAYQALHPEDKDVSEEDIKIKTIRNDGFPRIENDLGFLVRGQKIILMEAQSNWSFNVALRSLGYLIETYCQLLEEQNRLHELYNEKAIVLPEPEAYVIYPFSLDVPDVLSLAKIHFPGKSVPIEFQVKVLKEPEKLGIIGEYILFCRVFQEKVIFLGRTIKALDVILDECIERNILREYLKCHKEDFLENYMRFFSFEKALAEQRKLEIAAMQQKLAECKAEARAEGLAEGKAEGRAEGKAEGKAEGLAKGKAEEQVNTVRTLRAAGMYNTEIASLLHYDLAFVESVV